MKKLLMLLTIMTLAILTACGGGSEETKSTSNSGEDNKEAAEEKGTITFGATTWTSTKVPTEIAKQILQEAGYQVEVTTVAQPLIFEGLKNKNMDVFMDAWLPNTEAELWKKYKGSLQKVTASYKDVPLGWVVPSYMDAESISDLKGNADKYGDEVVTIGSGAGIAEISKDVFPAYGLDGYELITSSESAMMGVVEDKISEEEPFIITGWRPHSMFAKYDLKFLKDSKGLFKSDNVYVLSYQGLKDEHPEAYNILSQWGIKVADLEEMMLAYEQEGTSFEKLASQWIEENRDQVDQMLGK